MSMYQYIYIYILSSLRNAPKIAELLGTRGLPIKFEFQGDSGKRCFNI